MFKRTTAALLLASMLGLSQTACIGQMALAGKVGQFNLSVAENKWPRWIVFLLLYIIPVYPIAGAIDLIIINSIEFHTGTNPLTGKPRIALRDGADDLRAADGTRAAAVQNADGSVTVTVTETTGDVRSFDLVPVRGGVEARDADGALLGRVDASGSLYSALGPVPEVAQR